MPFNWNDFIDISCEIEREDYLSEKENGRYIEAYQRIMVANLYYAVFNLSLQLAKKISLAIPDMEYEFVHNESSVHGDIRRYFAKLSRIYRKNKEVRIALNELPEDLASLHEFRKVCHYQDFVNNLYSICEESMDLALNIRDRLNQIDSIFKDKREE